MKIGGKPERHLDWGKVVTGTVFTDLCIKLTEQPFDLVDDVPRGGLGYRSRAKDWADGNSTIRRHYTNCSGAGTGRGEAERVRFVGSFTTEIGRASCRERV